MHLVKHGSAPLTIEYVAKPLQMFYGLKNKFRVLLGKRCYCSEAIGKANIGKNRR